MTAANMHDDQISTDVGLVRRLLETQFPEWAELAIAPFASDGTTNAIYRLGDRLAVRLPVRCGPETERQIDKERKWLPRFAPHLPIAIPVSLAKGRPTEDYPSTWTVCEWIEGENPTLDGLDGSSDSDATEAAASLAQFVLALQRIAASAGPAPGAHNFFRGVPLAERDDMTHDAIARCEGLIDTCAVTSAWNADRDAPVWTEAPVWIHGDLAPGNLLSRDGQITAVIDWGGMAVGDPATELLLAWNMFVGESRVVYREALGVDDATWARGRGLALSQALMALWYYLETNAAIVNWARSMLREVLADHARDGHST